MAELEAPPELDLSQLQGLTPEQGEYITEREAWWETVLANARQMQADSLQTCANYNRELEALDRAR